MSEYSKHFLFCLKSIQTFDTRNSLES